MEKTLKNYSEQEEALAEEQEEFKKQHSKEEKDRENTNAQQSCIQEQIYENQVQSEGQDEENTLGEVDKDNQQVESQLLTELAQVAARTQQKVRQIQRIRTEGEQQERHSMQHWGIHQVQRAYTGLISECYGSNLA